MDWKVAKLKLPEKIQVIDSHTGGEPTRVIVSGWPEIPGGNLSEQLQNLKRDYDYLRKAVINEPHGHEAMVGAWIQESSLQDVTASVVFFNDVGYLGMCGHGMIGTIKTLIHLGKIHSSKVKIETPAGVVTAEIKQNGMIEIANVPGYVYKSSLEISVEGVGNVRGDIVYGGNWFFLVNSPQENLSMNHLESHLSLTKSIRKALRENKITGKNGAEIDHIEIFSDSENPSADSKNFVLCPGNAYDRSPCGTGTSAKMMALYEKGSLEIGEPWVQEGITGSLFYGRLEIIQGKVIPFIKSFAHLTAETTLIFDSEDEFRLGMQA